MIGDKQTCRLNKLAKLRFKEAHFEKCYYQQRCIFQQHNVQKWTRRRTIWVRGAFSNFCCKVTSSGLRRNLNEYFAQRFSVIFRLAFTVSSLFEVGGSSSMIELGRAKVLCWVDNPLHPPQMKALSGGIFSLSRKPTNQPHSNIVITLQCDDLLKYSSKSVWSLILIHVPNCFGTLIN